MKFFPALVILLGLTQSVWGKEAAPNKKNDALTEQKREANHQEIEEAKKNLLPKFLAGFKDKKELDAINKDVHRYAGKAVPSLIEVMKNDKYSDKSRWVATFMLGRAMGKKSAPFIAKFVAHPSWVMRLAALKVLLALKQTEMTAVYAQAMKDDSLIVRTQALSNVKELGLTKLSPNVWAMLYDKRNYYEAKKKASKLPAKRTNIIKDVIATIGELRFDKARDPLLKMIQKDKYSDVFEEMDFSLAKITGKDSPKGDKKIKRHYWSKYMIASKTI